MSSDRYGQWIGAVTGFYTPLGRRPRRILVEDVVVQCQMELFLILCFEPFHSSRFWHTMLCATALTTLVGLFIGVQSQKHIRIVDCQIKIGKKTVLFRRFAETAGVPAHSVVSLTSYWRHFLFCLGNFYVLFWLIAIHFVSANCRWPWPLLSVRADHFCAFACENELRISTWSWRPFLFCPWCGLVQTKFRQVSRHLCILFDRRCWYSSDLWNMESVQHC